ncbi:MAG: hypothetical protein RJA49_215, partial [Actinomycetota bacterium]
MTAEIGGQQSARSLQCGAMARLT